jgi:hypothetical protein
MKKKLLIALLAVSATSIALGVGQATARPESSQSTAGVTSPALLALITSDDLFSTVDLSTVLDPPATTSAHATQHYGPYTSVSTDSGTCGNDWANDTFDRHFSVKPNNDGTFAVVEQFKNGSFVTPASDIPPTNFSPGACQPSPPPAGTVNDGITGSMHGYFIISLPPLTTQTSTDSHCNAATMTNTDCDTATFISTHFSNPDYDVPTFFFHYSAGDQSLIYHEWKNASADRGGNSGDIRSTNLP